MTIRAMTEGDAMGGEAPPGKYGVRFVSGGGRGALDAARTLDVVANKVAKATLRVSGAGAMSFACLDLHVGDDGRQNRVRTPCKITIEGVAGTPTPDFGPAHAAGSARNQVTTADGVARVAVAPGKYHVTLSRGPEWRLRELDHELAEGADDDVCGRLTSPQAGTPGDSCTIERVVDTSGYVATDFHQHTMLGADAAVATRDRVVANTAEGVEIAVASEHNLVADLEPLVKELHLERELVQIAGDELTTDASRMPWGHANVFPMRVDATKPRGGAPVVKDRTARDVFDELRRRLPDPFVLQINHPRTGLTGYFDQYKLDRARGVGTDPGYDAGFDALEVWNGRNVDARDKVLEDFFALLRTKHPVTATADTDTHGIVGQEAGYPRTWVRVSDDRHLEDWSAARTQDLVEGVKQRRDVVLSNGPFLRVTSNGAPIGGVARGRDVTVKVHVESAPHVVVDRVELRRASGASVAKAVTMQPIHGGAVAADVAFDVHADTDDAFIVVATGSKAMTPVLSGEAPSARSAGAGPSARSAGADSDIAPWAMTGATWIDADGDGKSLGRGAK
jgi:hypothetical protein